MHFPDLIILFFSFPADIDDCVGVQCVHGVCVDGLGAWTCSCDGGYIGNLCESKLYVTYLPNVCRNVLIILFSVF